MNKFTGREHLKNLVFFSLSTKDLYDEDIGPGKNLFNKKKIQKLNSVSHTPDKLLNFSRSFLEERFSIFHLNIRLEVWPKVLKNLKTSEMGIPILLK